LFRLVFRVGVILIVTDYGFSSTSIEVVMTSVTAAVARGIVTTVPSVSSRSGVLGSVLVHINPDSVRRAVTFVTIIVASRSRTRGVHARTRHDSADLSRAVVVASTNAPSWIPATE
jgi:hypothetical protein